MRFDNAIPLTQIADLINARIIGRSDVAATGINEIHKVEEGDLVFVDHPKYYRKCIESAATYIIINNETEFPEGKALLLVDDPFGAYQTIVAHFRPFRPLSEPVSPTASVGPGTVVMPGAVIGHEVRIGRNCVIYPNAVILDHCVLEDDVVVGPGTVIGSDAFYYNRKRDRDIQYRRMLSGGRVVLQQGVEIGAGCTIDRGVSGDTVIGAGTKMDNLVHIGHDTIIGRNCLLAAQVGVAGATTIEDEVILWGQVGVSKTLTIGRGAEIYAQSGVPASLEGGRKYFGSPAEDAKQKMKELVWVKRIPELWRRLVASGE